MRSLAVISLLCAACNLLQLVRGQCDLGNAKRDVDFPDIEKDGVDSYQLSVEYTLPKLKQTDYYTEYYDLVERQGRVYAHQSGKSHSYIYMTQTWEAWEVSGRTCKLMNVTDNPSMMKDDMNEWNYIVADDDEKRTFGPSAMFKTARDVWNSTSRKTKMAYMGETDYLIRGLKAQFWRRCGGDNDKSYIDYFFTTDDEKDPLGTDLKRIPLRVFFGGKKDGMGEETSVQLYEIITLQPFISRNYSPFQLPKGIGCKRGDLVDAPKAPDFADSSLQFGAEVIYRKTDFNGDDVSYWSYYSTLSMAIDVESDHIAYYYSNWNSTKPEAKEEPSVLAPEYVIFDSRHGYAYKIDLESGSCGIEREKNFYPGYKLPNNAGELALTDPTFLFPGPGMTYLSEGENRGLKVYVFEEIVENYILNNITEITVPKAIITHSYLKDKVMERNSESIKNALVQVQVRLIGRQDKVMELLTFNFYDFDTEIKDQRFIFNIQRCFKNDDDYLWVTIGFNADEATLEKIKEDVPSIQANVLNSIASTSELNPVRVPIILVDVKEQLYVTLLILGKPPVLWDYLPPEQEKTLKGTTADVDGVQDIETCATKCLEEEDNCWAFSFCGAVCTFANEGTNVVSGKGCELYRRYDNSTFLQSKEMVVENIRREVETKELTLVLRGLGTEIIQLEPSSIEVIAPGEDDRLINRLGNKPNPRMRVVKAGAKLKEVAGKPVKNLGNLGFDECQKVCLDYKDCETVSYCINGGECIVSSQFGEDLSNEIMEDNNLCIIVTRKYSDLFNRSPGNVLSLTAQETLKLDSVEKCARACHKSSGYDCLSFDHCPQSKDTPCKLHTVHYPNSKTRENVQIRDTNCGHYYKKFSTEFQKNMNRRYLGSTVPPISNATLEECSKACNEYKKGKCFGFDFCQDGRMMATSCVILDSDPARMKSTYSEVCTNFLRTGEQFTPRPYSNSYAGGIGFLCFIIGLVVGCLVVFVVAYIKVNKH